MPATLITGINGLIGYSVAERLHAAGENVIGIDRLLTNAHALQVPVEEVDLTDTQRLHAVVRNNDVDRILHAGGISGPMLLQGDPFQVFDININGTMNIAEVARIHGVRRLVFLSSYVAYGEQPDSSPVAEDRALTATTPYAASKIAGEAVIRSYREHHALEGVSLRLGVVYGPRRTTACLVRLMLENALNQEETRLDFGADWPRPYVHIDDTVNAVCHALDVSFDRVLEHAYNVADNVWPTLDDIAREVQDSIPDIRLDMRPGCGPFGNRIGPLDLTAIARDLGYTPRVRLADGVIGYHTWLKNRRAVG